MQPLNHINELKRETFIEVVVGFNYTSCQELIFTIRKFSSRRFYPPYFLYKPMYYEDPINTLSKLTNTKEFGVKKIGVNYDSDFLMSVNFNKMLIGSS